MQFVMHGRLNDGEMRKPQQKQGGRLERVKGIEPS
jgi:hypothetical protein